MLDFVKRFVPEKMLEAAALRLAGKLAAAAAAAIVTLLLSHGVGSADATNVSEAISALVMALAVMAFHKWEGDANDTHLEAAAVSGLVPTNLAQAKVLVEAGAQVQAARESADAANVSAAINKVAEPGSNADALARLKEHTA